MTEEEAVAGWSPRERTTFDLLRRAYRKLRQEVGTSVYISRKMLAEAYGGNSIGTASKFMAAIEALEDDQPRRNRASRSASQEQQGASQAAPHPSAIQNALDALLAGVEGVSKVIATERAKDASDAAERCQRMLDAQRSTAEADLAAAEVRIADLELASVGAGEESWGAEALVEELRTGLAAAEMARDDALAAAREITQRLEVELAHAQAARVQIEALRGQVVAQAAELADLRSDARWLAQATDLGHKLRVENASLTERTALLVDQIGHLEALLRDANERHERERSQMRAEHERALADERRRAAAREALLMQQSGSGSQGLGGRS